MIEWDDYWRNYQPSKAEKYLISLRDEIIGNYIDKIHKPQKRVIEVGCGYGSNLRLIDSKREDTLCYGLDISIEAIRAVSRVIKNSIVSDCMQTCFPSKTFDIIYSSGLMEHFRDEIPFLSEMRRILKDSGYLLTIVPARYSLWELYQLLHFGLWQHGYEKAYTYNGLYYLFQTNGFHVVDIKGIDPLSFSGFLMKLFNTTSVPIFKKSINKSAYMELCVVARKKQKSEE
jgi:ubiquinone/menaquinone biosynthesis C-methylase UbiE